MQSLPFPPYWLAVAPDGAHAYALVGQQALTSTTPLLMIDLVSGNSRILSRVPGQGSAPWLSPARTSTSRTP